LASASTSNTAGGFHCSCTRGSVECGDGKQAPPGEHGGRRQAQTRRRHLAGTSVS
jgi:hypothetical protein